MLKSGSPTMTVVEIIMPFGDDDIIKYNTTFCDETTNTFKRALGFKEFQLERCSYLTMIFFKRLFNKSERTNPKPVQPENIEPNRPVVPVQLTKFEFMCGYHRADMDIEINALRKILFHLIREIEALRETNLQEANLNGILPKQSVYGQVYERVYLRSYNSAGPWSGYEKFLWDWFHKGQVNARDNPDELMMLRKLGYSDIEIQEYLNKVTEVSEYT